jgi:hypothetical protein
MPLDKITVDSISANAVTNVGIANGTIVSVDLADQAVVGSKLGPGAVSGNNLSPGAISGNNITSNSIRANNIVAGSISSNTLSSNLTISLTRVLEEANINSIAIGGNVNIDVSNSSVFFFNANTTANVTFNIRANDSTTFDSATAIGETTSVAIAVKHGTVRHEANLSIDGVQQTLYYSGNIRPANVSISNSEINLFSYSIFKTAANAYIVISANTLFGLG